MRALPDALRLPLARRCFALAALALPLVALLPSARGENPGVIEQVTRRVTLHAAVNAGSNQDDLKLILNGGGYVLTSKLAVVFSTSIVVVGF